MIHKTTHIRQAQNEQKACRLGTSCERVGCEHANRTGHLKQSQAFFSLLPTFNRNQSELEVMKALLYVIDTHGVREVGILQFTLACWTGYSQRHIQRLLNKLVSIGWLTMQHFHMQRSIYTLHSFFYSREGKQFIRSSIYMLKELSLKLLKSSCHRFIYQNVVHIRNNTNPGLARSPGGPRPEEVSIDFFPQEMSEWDNLDKISREYLFNNPNGV